MEVYNRTEVELSRIREQEETKRQRTLQVEKTKQAARSSEGYWVVRGLAVAAAMVSVVSICIAGYNMYDDKMHAEHPAAFVTSTNCRETAEVITNSDSSRSCGPGAWFESTPMALPGHILIRCHCGPKPAATASPSASSAP